MPQIDWLREVFVEDYLDYLAQKDNLTSSKVKAMRLAENFETLGFHVEHPVDDFTYLVGLLFVGYVTMFMLSFPPPFD